jgi:hypothetical protein
MTIRKIISAGIVFTFTAALYVHQHAEIYKTGYDLHQDRKKLACLVDRNSDLMYNLSKMETPRYLLASLGEMEIQFAGQRRENHNTYSIAGLYSPVDRYEDGFTEKVLGFFTPSAEADDHT